MATYLTAANLTTVDRIYQLLNLRRYIDVDITPTAAAVVVDANLTLTAPDNATLTSVAVTVLDPSDGTLKEILAGGGSNPWVVASNPTSPAIIYYIRNLVSGAGYDVTVDYFARCLREVTYQNTASPITGTSRTIRFAVDWLSTNAVITRLLASTNDRMDAYLRGSVDPTTLTTIPAALVQCGIDLLTFDLARTRPEVLSDADKDAYNEAIKYLEKIASGKVKLTSPSAATSTITGFVDVGESLTDDDAPITASEWFKDY